MAVTKLNEQHFLEKKSCASAQLSEELAQVGLMSFCSRGTFMKQLFTSKPREKELSAGDQLFPTAES